MNNEELKNYAHQMSKFLDGLTSCTKSQLIGVLEREMNQNFEKDKKIERLKNEIKEISQQHIYTLEILIETQTKIENAIQYINNSSVNNWIYGPSDDDLLKILGGEE